ncbi:MAG: sorting protein [Cypionkella sp.]|uniref:VPLPA-CTERM sorting domain-containing protein n=1 Tax=Cypionkella sp. TaxID=2811411 RepID=UPI00261DF6B9|nr:VPLPA-CTERM sorting domain-containing protein [Cypionkella sp.]MDB5657947.1 sorting protein [Cypionkella sp.]
MKAIKTLTGAAALFLASAIAASATVVAIFDGIAKGRNTFNQTVAAANGVVNVDTWANLTPGVSIDRGDYKITRNNGGSFSPELYGTMSGEVVNINPAGGGANPRTDPLDYFASGVTLTFANALNSIGFEVGDWATCCNAPTTDLFISFDNGTPINVASALNLTEGLFPSQASPFNIVNEIFVAAFDDSDSFKKVSFWGNGVGEFLVFGGEVRYALIEEGTLPPSEVPLPATAGLILAGLSALAATKRRKRT